MSSLVALHLNFDKGKLTALGNLAILACSHTLGITLSLNSQPGVDRHTPLLLTLMWTPVILDRTSGLQDKCFTR